MSYDGLDHDGDGQTDYWAEDMNQDGAYDHHVTDSNGNGVGDAHFYDQNQNQYQEQIWLDTNEDGTPDQQVWADLNEDGVDDRTQYNAPTIAQIGGHYEQPSEPGASANSYHVANILTPEGYELGSN
jgi:hypothetical protein